MDFLTTKGKALLGLVVLAVLGTIGFMSVNLLILMNQNHHLSEENEQLKTIVQSYQTIDRLEQHQQELEKVKAELNQ